MTEENTLSEAVSLLQDLGLKEYEARSFTALARVPSGTAKDIHELSEVPRTRVYDAIRVLEAQGLVEVQHSNPRKYRAVSIEEATETLRKKYENRIDTLETYLDDIEDEPDDEMEMVQEVWSLSGHNSIDTRTGGLLEEADSEIVLLVVDEGMATDELFDQLRAASERGVDVIIGGISEGILARVETELPGARVFQSGLEWLVSEDTQTEVAIGRLLLTDRTTLLVSSYYPVGGEERTESAVYASGLSNGVVVLIRRLLETGLQAADAHGE